MKQSPFNSAQENPLLSIENVSFIYPNGIKALNGVNMQIPSGSKTAILGANGAGKSTLFLHLNGILKPQSGRILLEGRQIEYTKSFLSELRKKVGIVFQDPDSQLFSVNVFQDISFGPMNLKYPPAEVKRRVEQAMEITGITDLRDRPTHSLSYGQKKRAAIAGVLAMDPSVIIFDEPTAGLDPQLTMEMLQIFNHLHQAGKTLILSTHEMDLAYCWSDYCYVLNQGAVSMAGQPEDLFTNSSLLEKNKLQKPWVLQVFEKLRENKLVDKSLPLPRTPEQLFNCIENLAQDKGTPQR